MILIVQRVRQSPVRGPNAARRNIKSSPRKDLTDLERWEETIRTQIIEDLLVYHIKPSYFFNF